MDINKMMTNEILSFNEYICVYVKLQCDIFTIF